MKQGGWEVSVHVTVGEMLFRAIILAAWRLLFRDGHSEIPHQHGVKARAAAQRRIYQGRLGSICIHCLYIFMHPGHVYSSSKVDVNDRLNISA